jgi:molecular chaperone GrpE
VSNENEEVEAEKADESEAAEGGASAEGTDAPAEPAEPAADPVAVLKDQLLRTAADFDNFRKRSRREMEENRRRAREDVLREMLPVVDNLERALASSEGTPDVNAVLDGVRMVLRGFEATASNLGLVRVATVGQRFDPAMHDALQQLESTEHEAGAIMAEIVAGYQLGERLLRPAQVVVSKGPGAAAPAAEAEPTTGEPEAAESTDE